MTSEPNVDSIFCEAVEITSDSERQTFLEQACGSNEELRARVDQLLVAHQQAGSFMQEGAERTLDLPSSVEQPGTRIGPYKLLQVIGEGGMGVVYMAEQTEPVERRVALKIIKTGMDTKQVIARFEAERQALALMDHPNIAKVLDAGSTDAGRPYFVMELVKGVPITQHCDEQRLSPQDRLQLFIQVCNAVQHAHQKGVIHRDIKPSNVLVALYDGQPVPKVIDFGVAKATGRRLTQKTMFTEYGQIVGTVEYMSPEQAQLNQLDIDTRSDIYSLGVLLYELLVGDTPFDRQRLRTAAFDELLRIIREEEPPKPSTKLEKSKTLSSVAAKRKIEPQKLGTMVRGELDWIVMKALDKDRSRRYDTAAGFATDIQHRLCNEPVTACPPSAWYRVRKFAQRNRAAMISGVLVSTALVLGIVVTGGLGWRLYQIDRKLVAELAKKESILKSLHDRIVEDALMAVISGDSQKGSQMIQAAEEAKVSASRLRTLHGLHDFYHGRVRRAILNLENEVQDNPRNIMALSALSLAYLYSGNWEQFDPIRDNLRARLPDVQDDYLRLLVCHVLGARSLTELNELIATHPHWALARAIRADHLSERLADDEGALDQAVEDITWARTAMPDSPYVIMTELDFYRKALQQTQDAGGDAEVFLSRATDALERLEQFPEYAIAHHAKYLFLWETGQKERAREVLKILEELGFGGPLAHAVNHYRSGDLDKAFEMRDGIEYEWMTHFQMFVVAELKGPADAEALYFKHLKKGKAIEEKDPHCLPRWAVHIAALRVFCRDPETIRSEIAELSEAHDEAGGEYELYGHYEGLRPLVEFVIGRTELAEIEDASKAGDARFDYFLALWHLGGNERERARERLKLITEYFKPFNILCHFARSLEEKLDRDPNWPASLYQEPQLPRDLRDSF